MFLGRVNAQRRQVRVFAAKETRKEAAFVAWRAAASTRLHLLDFARCWAGAATGFCSTTVSIEI